MIRRFVILGASGDLTSRYLLPALAQLHESGKLPEGFGVTGVDRRDWNTDAFHEHIAERLERHASSVKGASREALLSALSYRQADVTDEETVAQAIPTDEPLIAYLALPPGILAPAIEALAATGLPEGSRIVVEKPFGEDLASAQALNDLLHESFPEEAVFRIDHFLGHQTVQNILGLRFANRIFEPIWNCQHVAQVEIIWDETLALEGRASYYDRAGALKDMIQNHLLQLLCFIGMEAPLSLNARDLRDRKVDLLRAVQRLAPEEVARQTVRARYGAGKVDDQEIPAYIDEEGVDRARETETFAQVTLMIENWRWAGVPFSLRSGKALARNRREIAIHFRPVPHLAFGQDEEPRPNVLRLELDPDRVALELSINGPGDPFELEDAELIAELAPQEVPAYGRLLLDVLAGNPTLSIRDDEAEESWRIVEPILKVWEEGHVPMRHYPAGTEFRP